MTYKVSSGTLSLYSLLITDRTHQETSSANVEAERSLTVASRPSQCSLSINQNVVQSSALTLVCKLLYTSGLSFFLVLPNAIITSDCLI